MIGQAPKLLAFDWLSARARHLHFVGVLKRKTHFELFKTRGAFHSTKISGNFGPKLNGTVRSNRKFFGKSGPPFEVDHFFRLDRTDRKCPFHWTDSGFQYLSVCIYLQYGRHAKLSVLSLWVYSSGFVDVTNAPMCSVNRYRMLSLCFVS